MDNLTPMTPQDLIKISRSVEPPNSYWLDEYFTSTHRSEGKMIVLEDIEADLRKLAPLVLPTDRGRPIHSMASSGTILTPGYVKIKDPVVVDNRFTGGLGGLHLTDSDLTLAQRHDAKRASIVRQHKNAWVRRKEFMAAKAIIEGRVTLDYVGAPSQIIDFGRHSSLDVTKLPGAQWGDVGVSIIDDMQMMIDRVFDREGGGVNKITIGTDVWKVIRQSPEFKDLMDKNIVGSDVELSRGLLASGEVRLVGRISGIPVYIYSGWYQEKNEAGQIVTRRLMDPRDVVFTSPLVAGVRAFGAIDDARANFASIPLFQIELEPDRENGKTDILSQSAPLMIPTNPDATARLRPIG